MQLVTVSVFLSKFEHNTKKSILNTCEYNTHFNSQFISPRRASSGNDVASESGDVNATVLVVGLVFGFAGAALLVLGGWFALKKFYWAGGSLRAFN